MKQNRRVFIPAIIVTVIGLLLVLYSFYSTPSGGHHGPPPTGGGHPGPPSGEKEGKGGLGGTFKQLGTFAIICGAISYSWFYLKRKMKSPSNLIKKLGKLLYKVHTYVAWAALILVVAHGTYYIIKDFNNPATLTGISAFIILLTLAMYGWFIKRIRNKFMRTIHFLLSHVWLVLLVIHAGGHFILPAAITLMIWGIIWLFDLSARKTAAKHA